MRRLALACLGAAIVALPVAAAEAQSGPRVVDRTLVCSTAATRDLDLASHPHTVYASTTGVDEVVAAFLHVSSGVAALDWDLVAVRARRLEGLGGEVRAAGVYAHATRCSPTRASVPLSAKGLPGPPVRWYKDVSCAVARRVLVHVRAVLTGPAEWRRAGAYYGARTGVVEAKLAVRAAGTGRPVAYLELSGGKKTRFWYAGGCG